MAQLLIVYRVILFMSNILLRFAGKEQHECFVLGRMLLITMFIISL